MKTFKYKWRLKDQEYVGSGNHKNEQELRNHVKKIGGELIE